MSNYTQETITQITSWTDHLFSFRITRPNNYRFIAGQFARLGVETQSSSEQSLNIAWRAYSIVSASYDDYLEFYSIVVPNGEFTSRLSSLSIGAPILLDKQNHGFLTVDRFHNGKDLWLLATGTGLAPFLSMLHEPDLWVRFENIFLVHSVRERNELTYQTQLTQLKQHELLQIKPQQFHYIPIVTRDSKWHGLKQRLPALIASGELESMLKHQFNLEHSRFMLCGNPEMVEDTRNALKLRGFSTHRQAKPGHIVVENYW